jgi:tRNA threonylcarbamoyl adenosine modification protein YjeE
MKFTLKSAEDTANFASEFKDFLAAGDVICLHGDLGAGKTTFSQGLIKAFNPEITEVVSPTFNLVQIYDAKSKNFTGEIWHFDFYRLENPYEVYEIGLEEALTSAVSLIEWPEKISGFLPDNCLHLYLSSSKLNPDSRIVEIDEKGEEKWQKLITFLAKSTKF